MTEYKTLQENQTLNLEYQRNKKEREMKEEIERLHSIIKEVREYIEKHKHLNWYNDSCYMNDLLEILDKEK